MGIGKNVLKNISKEGIIVTKKFLEKTLMKIGDRLYLRMKPKNLAMAIIDNFRLSQGKNANEMHEIKGMFDNGNIYEKKNRSGAWGGYCYCPDGQRYAVGDNGDSCQSLRCFNGVSGKCNKRTGKWSNWQVTCDPDGKPKKDNKPKSDQSLLDFDDLKDKIEKIPEIDYESDAYKKSANSYKKGINGAAGAWGGFCTCPDGLMYGVGDNNDGCMSLSCENGTQGTCYRRRDMRWAFKSVYCSSIDKVDKNLSKKEEKDEWDDFDVLVSYKIEHVIFDTTGVDRTDDFHMLGIFANMEGFLPKIAESLKNFYPKSIFLKKIAEQNIPELKLEDFSSKIIFNFPNREDVYQSGNYDEIDDFFIPEAGKIVHRIGHHSVKADMPIIDLMYKIQLPSALFSVLLSILKVHMLYISGFVVYNFILKSANQKVFEIGVQRVVGFKKSYVIEMCVVQALFMSFIAILIGLPLTGLLFHYGNI